MNLCAKHAAPTNFCRLRRHPNHRPPVENEATSIDYKVKTFQKKTWGYHGNSDLLSSHCFSWLLSKEGSWLLKKYTINNKNKKKLITKIVTIGKFGYWAEDDVSVDL